LDNTQHLFDDAIFYGFYRDDGLCANVKGIKSKAELAQWRNTFQDAVNKLLKSN